MSPCEDLAHHDANQWFIFCPILARALLMQPEKQSRLWGSFTFSTQFKERLMKTNRIVAALMGVLACGILSFASTARAEDAPSNSSVPFWEKTKVTGTFDTSYNFNFNNPACPAAGCPAANALRVFDTRHNSFDFNLAEIAIENHPASWATFRLDLDFGQDVPAVTGLYNFA